MSDATDIFALTPINWTMFSWFANQHVPRSTLMRMIGLQTIRGVRGEDGWLEPTPDGRVFVAFYEQSPNDVVFWCPRTNEFAGLRGRVFALGEDNIADPSVFAFDANLHIYADALTWLRDDGRGIVILDWSRAFDRLRHVPRIAVTERLLPTYLEYMKPRRMPELSVIAPVLRIAA